jgi:hypothetical protein
MILKFDLRSIDTVRLIISLFVSGSSNTQVNAIVNSVQK